MRRLAAIACIAALCGGAGVLTAAATADDSRTYTLEMLDAFGVVEGSEVRVAGVAAGTVESLEISPEKRALVAIELSGPLAELGEETTCRSQPQSLIAEYFIDCEPGGEPLPDGGLIPAEQVRGTVQTDLLLNALREPYTERLRLIVNELGTAMAGNSENLNAAIRQAVPALAGLDDVTAILARQRRAIARLNVNAEQVVSRLAERRADVVSAIGEAEDTAVVAAERRADLGRGADLLDDFMAELRPTLAALGDTARDGTPLLAALRAAAPSLNRLSARLPRFGAASEDALVTLGAAAGPGRAALERGRDELAGLARAARDAPATAEILADLLRDLDDPRRHVETDARAARRCQSRSRPCWSTGRAAPTGYTGFEGLLNYAYYQSLAVNQFDSLGHMLQFNVYAVPPAPCTDFNAQPNVPAAGGGRTKNILEADPCVSWLGPNQPDVSFDLGLPRYDASVCPQGSTDLSLCDPGISTGRRPGVGRADGPEQAEPDRPGESRQPEGPGETPEFPGAVPTTPQVPGLPELPELPPIPGLPGGTPQLPGSGGGEQTTDLLDFLLGP